MRFSFNTLCHAEMYGFAPNLPGHVRAAADAGWDEIGFDVGTILAHERAGVAPERLGALAREHGLGCYELAALVVSADPEVGSKMLDAVLTAVRGVHPQIVYAVSFDPLSPALVDAAGRARDALAIEGTRLAIEFVPGFGVGTLADALALAKGAAADVGVVLDVWALLRSGGAVDNVADIPLERVAFLQLSDVAEDPLSDVEMECNHGRLLPGEGIAAAPELCAMARRVGYDGHISLEVLSDEWRGRPVAALATAGLAAARAAWGSAEL